jgi:hypothetical protein
VRAPAEDHRGAEEGRHRSSAPARDRAGEDTRAAAGPARPVSATSLRRLQRTAGNRAASRLMAQRRSTVSRAAPTKKPAIKPGTTPTVQRLESGERGGPNSDPKFAALKADVRDKQKSMSAHPPATSEANAAAGAAKPPQDDKEAQGKTANAEKMNAAKPGEFDKAAFIKAVNEAIAAQAPKNLDEADKFGDSGKADAVKGQVQGQVQDGKKESAGQIESTTKAAPDTSAAKDKQVTPLKPDQPPGTPAAPDAANAVPDKAPPSATDFSAGPKQVDQQLTDAQVTEEQLSKSNEPEFTGALKEKKEGEKHAETAPGQVRASEAETLSGAKAQAAKAGGAAMTALSSDRKQAGAQVGEGKEGAKGKDESKRAQVTAKLQKVFDATKKDVEQILSDLDKKVDDKFTTDEKAARDAFTADHKRRMKEYKDKRYSGFWGPGKWLKDKFLGMPKEADQIFVEARKGYVNRMQQVISGIADVIGAELNRAKQRIATGRNELQAEVKKLPADLQAIGKEAAGEFSAKFDELTDSVDAKGKELVNTLATKYNDALKSVDEEIEKEKEKNKGLIAKAVDAIKGVIDTILKLKDLLLGILAKAARAVLAIIKDPIGFLGKLVSAVGAGLKAFIANIAAHLKKGLVRWLTGAMSGAGLEIPAKFDLRGIIMMIGSLLGLTWGAIRSRVISMGVPEPAMATVEKSVPVAQKLKSEGVGGVWQDIKEKVGDLKENLFSKIAEYLIPTVLVAGITWIVSLLNPASAFIRACKMIIDFVTFIITNAAQIAQFINAVLDAIIAIAGGGAGGVPALIENALSLSIPVLIGALAAILGIGGIANKVKSFFQTLSKPVLRAVDWIVSKIVAFGKKIWAKLKSKFGKDGKEKSAKEKQKIAQKAADDGYRAASGVPIGQVSQALDGVHSKWQKQGLKSLEMKPLGDHYFTVEASVNPKSTAKAKGTVDVDPEQLDIEHVTASSFASSTTSASGAFSADTSTEVTDIMQSGASKKKLELSDSQEHAHAEEQVVNKFQGRWNARSQEIKQDLPPDKKKTRVLFDRVRMAINVSKSSCINCASYIVRFTKKLRDRAESVHVGMKFASLYQGRQKIPQSNMDEHGNLVRVFVDKGKLKKTSRLGRLWGPNSIFKGKSERVTEVPGGKGGGKAGLAILRQAGIDVDVISESDVKGDATTRQSELLERRNKALQKALVEVDDKLNIKKG